MGFGIVNIRKITTNGSLVTYEFAHEGGESGRFTIHAETGACSDLGPEQHGRAHLLAQAKVLKAWRDGSLPDTLVWAG